MRNYLYGYLQGLGIPDALQALRGLLPIEAVAVLRVIDSHRSVEDLSRILRQTHVEFDCVNNNICLSLKAVFGALEAQLFNGFDEIWFFADEIPGMDIANFPTATSEAATFEKEPAGDLLQALKDANCLLVLGDGCGLNYCTWERRIAASLIALQP